MEDDEVLLLCVKGSHGFKNIRLCNQIGIVDQDYYNNPGNEGHIWVALQNEGQKDFTINRGDPFVQGIFTKYLITDDDYLFCKKKRYTKNDEYLKK